MLQFQDSYPLRDITTLMIGGPARKFTVAASKEELEEAIITAGKEKLPYLVIGSGSNLLVSDKGFDGLVIKNKIKGMRLHPGGVISVKSGTSLGEFVDFTIENRLSGLQKLTGIPGTVGGAIYGNAGAYGQSISDHITKVMMIDSSVIPAKECNFGYRDSIFKKTHYIILEVYFQLEPGDPQTLQQEAKDVLSKRLIKYPPGIKCPGSFFKNLVVSEIPPQILKNIPQEKIVYGKLPAGTLLEAVGAKGQKLDGIEIASYHANLFINKGGGSAKAFYNLAQKYADKVKEKFGIILEPEVQLINLPLFSKLLFL